MGQRPWLPGTHPLSLCSARVGGALLSPGLSCSQWGRRLCRRPHGGAGVGVGGAFVFGDGGFQRHTHSSAVPAPALAPPPESPLTPPRSQLYTLRQQQPLIIL